ncbi:MAG: hypothetical protein U9P44_00955, partial [archaeon]|nr:hypothetical protein [archaeon]
MDDDIKKLNPSVNYNEKPIGKNNVSAFEKKMKEKYDKELKTFWANDRFYKYFSFLIIVIFTIVI